MIAGFLAAGVSNITMAVGLKPISDDLGWSRTLNAQAAITTWERCSGGILSPSSDRLADVGAALLAARRRRASRVARLRA